VQENNPGAYQQAAVLAVTYLVLVPLPGCLAKPALSLALALDNHHLQQDSRLMV
jgi:hypothetical protein